VICIPDGLQKFQILSDGTWVYRSNVRTGSDFNKSGRWRIITGNGTDIIEWHFLRDWSCAHPPTNGNAGNLDKNYYKYSRYLIRSNGDLVMWLINTWQDVNPPEAHSAHTSLTIFRRITQTEYSNRYSQENFCQGCTCVCCNPGCVHGQTHCADGCVVTCQDTSGNCLCTCPAECSVTSHSLPACTGKRDFTPAPAFEQMFYI